MGLLLESIPGSGTVIVYGAPSASNQTDTIQTFPIRSIELEFTADVDKMEAMWRDIRRDARREKLSGLRLDRAGRCHCGSGIDARFCGCHKPAQRNARTHP